MKWMKQGAAAVLVAALALSLLATGLMAASKNWLGAELGDLSQYYETGNTPIPASTPRWMAIRAARPTASTCSPAMPARR